MATKLNITICSSSFRIKDREIEVVGEKNDEDIKNFRQKIKHLHYEHENKCRLLQAQAMMALQQCETEHREQQFVLLADKSEGKRRLQTLEKNHTDKKKCMKLVITICVS